MRNQLIQPTFKMKNLITIIIMLVCVGCATTPTMKSIVGSYEAKIAKNTLKMVFLENGTVESYVKFKNIEVSGEETLKFTQTIETSERKSEWRIDEKEVHVDGLKNTVAVYRVEPNGDLTGIAYIEYGKRHTRSPHTFKKIK